MKNVLTIVEMNPTPVMLALVALFLIVIALLILTGKKKEARFMIYMLVLQAEKNFISKSGKGHTKYMQVLMEINKVLPPILRIFITHQQLHIWIQEAWRALKDITDNGVMDDSVKEVDEIESQ